VAVRNLEVGAQGDLNGEGPYDSAGVFVEPPFLSLTARQNLTEPGAGESFPLFAEGWAMQALAYVARTARPLSQIGAPEKRGLAPWQLRRATEMFRSGLTENLKLQRVAEACRLSASHFSRAFRTSTGLPPHRWVMRKRVERAQDLLVGPFVPLAEIALTCGFADQSHFSRVFRVIRGVSPGAWRRQHRVRTPEWSSQARKGPIPEARAFRSA
jgi:AraC-like DNA-binding protein